MNTNGTVLLVLHACHVVLLLVLRWFWCGSTEIPSCPAPAAPDASLTRGRGRLWCTTRGRFECPRPGTVAGCGGMARWLGTWPGAVAGHGGRAGSPCPNPMSLPQGPCPNPSPNPCPNPMICTSMKRSHGRCSEWRWHSQPPRQRLGGSRRLACRAMIL